MKKLARILLLIGFCLGCFTISCARTPQIGKQDLAGKAAKLKDNLDALRRMNNDYKTKKNRETDTKKKSELIDSHVIEANTLLNDEVKPSYDAFINAFNGIDSKSVNKIKIQEDISKLEAEFKYLENGIKGREVSEAVEKNLPQILTSLDNIVAFVKSSPSTNPQVNANTTVPQPPPSGTTPTTDPSNGDSETTSLFQYLWWLIPIFISVLISFGLLFMYKHEVNKQFDSLAQRFSAIQRQIEANQIDAMKKFTTVNQMFNENRRAVESLQTGNPPNIQAEVKTLKTRLEALEQNSRISNSLPQSFFSDLPENNSFSQEGTVADFMNRSGGNGIKAKPAFMPNDALEQSDNDAIYMLFQNASQRSSFLAIPIHPRFASTQDYSHFSKFYECEQPSSGEIWIVDPAQATYDEQSNQWRLYKRGKLQIK